MLVKLPRLYQYGPTFGYGHELTLGIIEGCNEIVQRNLGANNRFIKDFPLFRNTVHIAASFDRHEICDMLLQFSKEDMYQLDKVGTGTPMNIAVRLGHFKVVEVLLKHCDESKANNNFYKADLVLAVTLVHADVVHVLLKHGVNVHTNGSRSLLQIALSDECWLRAQYFASTYDVERIVVMLIEHGAPTDGLSTEQQKLLEQILKHKNEIITPSPLVETNSDICYIDVIIEHRDTMSVILDKLHLREFSRFIRTSKKFQAAVENYKIWQKKLHLLADNIFDNSAKRFTQQTIWARLVQRLKVTPLSMFQQFDEIVISRHFYKLKYLDARLLKLMDKNIFCEVIAKCTNLQTLKLPVSFEIPNSSTMRSTSLTRFEILMLAEDSTDQGMEFNVFKALPNLQHIKASLSYEATYSHVIHSIQQHCTALKKLHLLSFNLAATFSDADLLKNFSNLESLGLEFTPSSLDVAARHCVNLTKLTIYGNEEVSRYLNQPNNAVQYLTKLVSLKLQQAQHPAVDELVARLLNSSATIRKLDVGRSCSTNVFEILSGYKGELTSFSSSFGAAPHILCSKWPVRAFSTLRKLKIFTITPQQFYTILEACPKLENVEVSFENEEDPERSQVNFGQIFARARKLKKLMIKGTFDKSNFGELVIAPKLTWLELDFCGVQMDLFSDAIMVYLAQCCPLLKRLSLPSGMIFSQCVTVLWRKYFQHLSELEFSYFNDLQPWIRAERTGGVKTYFYRK